MGTEYSIGRHGNRRKSNSCHPKVELSHLSLFVLLFVIALLVSFCNSFVFFSFSFPSFLQSFIPFFIITFISFFLSFLPLLAFYASFTSVAQFIYCFVLPVPFSVFIVVVCLFLYYSLLFLSCFIILWTISVLYFADYS